jgi:membrane protein
MASSATFDDTAQNPDTVSQPVREREREHERGRDARTPGEIPARGWLDIAVRVFKELSRDNVSLIAAGLALYALLAVFPALGAAVSIYGLFASPDQISQQMQAFSDVLPADATRILDEQLRKLAAQNESALSVGAVLGLFLALWSARKGMVALLVATNVAYDEEEKRGFFKKLFISMGFTVGAVLGFIALLIFGVVLPLGLKALPLGDATELTILIMRWALLRFIAVTGLAIVYRYAPDRQEPQWRWASPGSVIGATLWLLGSLAFAIYVRNSATYGETYGALGGVVILLMWFYLSGYIIILGAEINCEMERQTTRDTTESGGAPMGQRGAYAADTLGKSQPQMSLPQNNS